MPTGDLTPLQILSAAALAEHTLWLGYVRSTEFTSRSSMAAVMMSSPTAPPQRPNGMFEVKRAEPSS